MDKKVSVIIPVYNVKPKYIEEAVNSVLNQTYKNIEIIIVNDGSDDNQTLNFLKCINNEKIKVINQENKGLSAARNTGITTSSGEYILPLDSDDKIEKTYIEKAVKVIENNLSIGMVYCEAEHFGAKTGKWELPEYNREDFLYTNCIFCSALYRKTDWEKAGKYDEKMRDGCEDWDLWLSFIELGLKPFRIPEVLFYYRKHASGSMLDKTSRKIKSILKQIVNNHENLYLSSDEIVPRIFGYSKSDNMLRIQKKYEKYKKLFNILLIVSIVEGVAAVALFVFLLIFGRGFL